MIYKEGISEGWGYFVSVRNKEEKKQKSRMSSRFLDDTGSRMLSFPVRGLGKISLERNNGCSYGNQDTCGLSRGR